MADMAVAEGKTFKFEDESGIQEDYLETIEYDGSPRK